MNMSEHGSFVCILRQEAHLIFVVAIDDVVAVCWWWVLSFCLAYGGIEFCCDITNDGEYCQCFIRLIFSLRRFNKILWQDGNDSFFFRLKMDISFFTVLSAWFLQLLSSLFSLPARNKQQPASQKMPLHKMQLYFLTLLSLSPSNLGFFSAKYFISFFATANSITEWTFVAAAPATFLWCAVSSWMLHKAQHKKEAKNKQEFYSVPLAF